MSYIINKFSGPQLVVLEDGTINTSTSIGLVGRNYVGYGETQNENFVFLLENFSNDSAPSRPIQGQTWFNSTNSLLYVYNGTAWAVVGAAILSATAPEQPANGALWLDSDINTLNIWNGTAWEFIGPEVAEGFDTTRAKSTTVLGIDGNRHPVILLTIDGTVTAICSTSAFTISLSETIEGFLDVVAGITMSTLRTFKGDIIGNASSASQLEELRTINGIVFNGTSDIIVQASTSNNLIRGDYLTGSNFNGSMPITWSVDASSANVIGKVVARNSQGGFAAGTITADLVGNVVGNVTATTGTSVFDIIQATQIIGPVLRGNSSSATRLQTGRNINGTYFDGSSDVTVTAAAGTLTGTTLNGAVTTSSLTSVGILTSLKTAATGVEVDSSIKMFTDTGGIPTIRGLASNKQIKFDIVDTRQGNITDIRFIPSADSLALGGQDSPALIPTTGTITNLGHPTAVWNQVYASNLVGNADTATLAATATNIAAGAAGSIPYQTAASTTNLLPVGIAGTVLTAGAAGTLSWLAIGQEALSSGTHLSFINTVSGSPVLSYSLSTPTTLSIDATSSNTAGTVVARDSSGNFSAGTITATVSGNVTGNVTGNSTTATQLQTARTINGTLFNGTSNITISAPDTTKVPLAGGAMTGYLTLVGTPVDTNHATTKAYVDSRIPQYQIISGASYSTAGFTNQVGSFNDGANYFDVYPPAGKTMANLVAFIPSIHIIHFAGGVNGDDSLRCTYSYLSDRVRVYVQNTEQRSTPAANYLVIWSQ